MRIFALVGYPLAHSFSKRYFTDFFERESLDDCHFENYEIEDISVIRKIVSDNSSLSGFNVTIPHKKSIMPYLDEIDNLALAAGAVNCVKILRDGNKIKLIGYNTDVIGFETSLSMMLKGLKPKALVLGDGGAAAAVKVALNRMTIDYDIVSRSSKKGCLTYNDLNERVFSEYKLVINTTPLGTFPNTNTYPDIPYHLSDNKYFAHDLVYNPSETLFLHQFKLRGATIKNGFQMLIKQADVAWKIYNENE